MIILKQETLVTKLDFYLKPQLETNLSGVEVNPFPENSSLYENRYKLQ